MVYNRKAYILVYTLVYLGIQNEFDNNNKGLPKNQDKAREV